MMYIHCIRLKDWEQSMRRLFFVCRFIIITTPLQHAKPQADLCKAVRGRYHTYRIPALSVTAKGTVWLFVRP
jgi:hypothetical protein